MIPRVFSSLIALALLNVTTGNAAIVFSEASHGDLSGSFTSPTPLNLAIGENTIIAQMGNNGNTGATTFTRDADYFTFTLTPGQFLQSLTIASYTFSPTNPGRSFAAYVPAAAFLGQAEEHIAGLVLFNAESGNVLDDFTSSTQPLSAGTYAFWFQETANTTVDYQLTLTVVPEATTTLLIASTLLLCLLHRAKQSQ